VRTVLSLLSLAAGVALLAVAVSERERVTLPAVAQVAASGRLDGGERFGDPVRGQLDVLVPLAAADPAAVRWSPSFAPFRLAGPVRVRRWDDGRTTLVRYEFSLECLAAACLPSRSGESILLPPAVVRVPGKPPARVAWPALAGASRQPAWTRRELAWRSGLGTLPPIGTHLAPRLLAAGLLAAALLAAAASVALLAPGLLAVLPRRAGGRDTSTVLDRALAAVRSAAGVDDVAERRRALDLLARELWASARPAEGRTARRLAWSRANPGAGEMEQLVDQVERTRP
jgi:hypothetical protein